MYNVKLLKDYILGNDIVDENIEVLENNVDFMTQVIAMSKDKNFYNLCGNKVRGNFNFVKFLIKNYSCDKNYLHKVVDNFLRFNKNEIERMDIILTMCNLINNKDDDKYIYYCTKAYMFYSELKLDIEVIKQNPEDQKLIGEGFILIMEEYGSSLLIKNYFAKHLILDIFEDYDIDLEKYLHCRFSNFEDIKKEGLNTVLISIIKQYDSTLSSYLMINPYLLDDWKKKLLLIERNWNKYEINALNNKYEILFDIVSKYIDNNYLDIHFSTFDIIGYFALKLGFMDELKIIFDYDLTIFNGFDISFIDIRNMDAYELHHFNVLRNIITGILKKKIVDEPDIYDIYYPCNSIIKLNKMKK